MVDFKYKIADVAKDFGMSTKKVLDTFAGLTGETRKSGGVFDEKEVNSLLEALTRETAVDSLDEYLASGKKPAPKPEPKPQPKAAEPKKAEPKSQPKAETPKKAESKPQPRAEAPKAEPKKPEAKPQRPAQQEKRSEKRPEKQAEKRSEKRVTMQELAADSGIHKPVATEQVQV
ncbi:MAG: hypothetical protein SPK62_01315, partial [Gemmiger sp.]|nr:hypothetical protein [Gemmiger sp.]